MQSLKEAEMNSSAESSSMWNLTENPDMHRNTEYIYF